jgi:hypothetical protein
LALHFLIEMMRRRFAALGPHKNNQCAAKEPNSNPSDLAVVGSVILDLKIGAREDLLRVVEVETSISKRPLAFGRVVVDEHGGAPSFLVLCESLSSPMLLARDRGIMPKQMR